MEYWNTTLSVFRSPEFVGAEPVDRATWVCLMVYSIDQENAGVVESVADWGDRRLMQTMGVTSAEIRRDCELWEWVGDDVHVKFYPIEHQRAAERARANGKRGGRPKKNQPTNQGNNPQVNQLANPNETYSETIIKDKIIEDKIIEDNTIPAPAGSRGTRPSINQPSLAFTYPESLVILQRLIGNKSLGMLGALRADDMSDDDASRALRAYAALPIKDRRFYPITKSDKIADALRRLLLDFPAEEKGAKSYGL